MKVLQDALVNKVNELTESVHNTFYLAIGGRFYDEQPPQNATFPYAIYTTELMSVDRSFDSLMEIWSIQIYLFSETNDDAEINDIYDKLITLFPDRTATLSVTGYTCVYMNTILSNSDFIDDVWQYLIQYEVMISKAS